MCGGATVHSKMTKTERTRVINKFKSGEIKVVVQVLVLNIGFDLPALDCIIFARPSKSLRIWAQTVGRGIRIDPEDPEKICRCIDMGGMLKLYGRIEDVKVKGGVVYGTYGSISDKALNRVNISEMQRRYH
jgi:superfamily II DNA or RNA helicase